MYYGRMTMKSLLKFIALHVIGHIMHILDSSAIDFAIALLAFWKDFR